MLEDALCGRPQRVRAAEVGAVQGHHLVELLGAPLASGNSLCGGRMMVFPSAVGLPLSAGTSSSWTRVIGGATMRPLTTASASRSSNLLDISRRKFTPETPW